MSVTLTWKGLAELREALRHLPETLATEAGDIVYAHAGEAKQTVEAHYPEGPTGNLRARVTLEREASRFGAAVTVRSRAPHASLFEKGTTTRTTASGANRGAMPRPPADQRMIPAVVRLRRRMTAALVAMVRAQGFRVDGA